MTIVELYSYLSLISPLGKCLGVTVKASPRLIVCRFLVSGSSLCRLSSEDPGAMAVVVASGGGFFGETSSVASAFADIVVAGGGFIVVVLAAVAVVLSTLSVILEFVFILSLLVSVSFFVDNIDFVVVSCGGGGCKVDVISSLSKRVAVELFRDTVTG